MKCCILVGSPRKNGNTIALTKPFIRELEREERVVSFAKGVKSRM